MSPNFTPISSLFPFDVVVTVTVVAVAVVAADVDAESVAVAVSSSPFQLVHLGIVFFLRIFMATGRSSLLLLPAQTSPKPPLAMGAELE